MSRSLKKGPYTFDRLLKRVKALNETGKKEVLNSKINVAEEDREFLRNSFNYSEDNKSIKR